MRIPDRTAIAAPGIVGDPSANRLSDIQNFRSSSLHGMPLDVVDLDQSIELISDWSRSSTSRFVVTPNTDHFLRWQKNPSFRTLYAGADLVTTDGAPLAFLARLEGVNVHRVTGVDLFNGAVARAAVDGVPLIIVGGMPGVAERAADELKKLHPGLVVPLVISPTSAELESDEWLASLAVRLAEHPEKLVALCLGSPKQERLFYDLRRIDSGLSGAFLCVGAAVDFAAGTLRRAPAVFQNLGIEWMFRLIVEPRRLWRRYLIEDVQILGYVLRSMTRRASGHNAAPGRPRDESALHAGTSRGRNDR